MNTDDKNVRDAAMLPIMDAIAAEHPELTAADLDLISYKLQKKVVRTWLLEDGKRVDGRGINEIRPLAAEVGRAAPCARLRHVHPRPDPGPDHLHPWLHQGRPAHGRPV